MSSELSYNISTENNNPLVYKSFINLKNMIIENYFENIENNITFYNNYNINIYNRNHLHYNKLSSFKNIKKIYLQI